MKPYLRPDLTLPQTAALRAIAGLDRPGKKPWPQTLIALEKKGLIENAHTLSPIPTPLGRVAAAMEGWIPTPDQCELIRALAAGQVRAGGRYDLPRLAPATLLYRWRAAGLVARGRHRSGRYWTATTLCRQLAAHLGDEVAP